MRIPLLKICSQKKMLSHWILSLFSEITQIRLIKKKVSNKMKRRTQTIHKEEKKAVLKIITNP